MAFYSYLSTKIIIAFITKSYQDLFGVRSYINADIIEYQNKWEILGTFVENGELSTEKK